MWQMDFTLKTFCLILVVASEMKLKVLFFFGYLLEKLTCLQFTWEIGWIILTRA